MDISELAEYFEKELNLPEEFCSDIFFECKDDWTYIIRLHALVEAAVSNLITKRLNEVALQDIFSRLELGNEITGKIAFGKLLNVLDKLDLGYIKAISELRNKLVHNIEQVTFSLSYYHNSLDDNQLRSLTERLLHGKTVVQSINKQGYSIKKYFTEDARHPWFIGALIVLHGMKMNLDGETNIQEKKIQSSIQIFSNIISDYRMNS